jgi:hypothetical protein
VDLTTAMQWDMTTWARRLLPFRQGCCGKRLLPPTFISRMSSFAQLDQHDGEMNERRSLFQRALTYACLTPY